MKNRLIIFGLIFSVIGSLGIASHSAVADGPCNPTDATTCPGGTCVRTGQLADGSPVYSCTGQNGTSGPVNTQGTVGPTNTGPIVTLVNPLGSGVTLSSLWTSILSLIIELGTVVVVLMIIYIGFKFVMAQGEPKELAEAKTALLWTIIGALILLGAKGLSDGIQATVHALGG